MTDAHRQAIEAGAQAWMARSTDQSNAAWQNARLHAAIFVGGAEPVIRTDEAKRIALKWQWGGWSILTAPVKAGSINVLRLGQLVTDWLHAEVDHD